MTKCARRGEGAVKWGRRRCGGDGGCKTTPWPEILTGQIRINHTAKCLYSASIAPERQTTTTSSCSCTLPVILFIYSLVYFINFSRDASTFSQQKSYVPCSLPPISVYSLVIPSTLSSVICQQNQLRRSAVVVLADQRTEGRAGNAKKNIEKKTW